MTGADACFVFLLAISILYFTDLKVDAIGCFVCTSINHNNRACEDTFNNTDGYYDHECWASRKGRIGLFPGTQCIKMKANDVETGFSLVIRDCVADNGGTNSETEIGRQSHCGWMGVVKYEGKRMNGCLLTCQTDACNAGTNIYTIGNLYWTLILVAAILIQCNTNWLV